MKICHITLLILGLMTAVSNGQDWLGGGYVGHGDSGEASQYYMDPIFYFNGYSHYMPSDPAIKQMRESLDYPINGHYPSSDPAIRQMQESLERPRHINTEDISIIGGHWQLALTDGTSIDLVLSQSGNNVFGYGFMDSDRENQRVTASGSIYGTNLELEITSAGGIKSYAVSIDVGYWPLSGTYMEYRDGAYPQSGSVNAVKLR